MDKTKIMIEIGRLEVRFEKDEQVLSELSHFLDQLRSDDINQIARVFGRIQERIGETDKSVQEIHRILRRTKYPLSIKEIGLTDRTYRILTVAKIKTVGQIAQMTNADLCKIRNLGQEGMDEIIEIMNQLGLELAQTIN